MRCPEKSAGIPLVALSGFTVRNLVFGSRSRPNNNPRTKTRDNYSSRLMRSPYLWNGRRWVHPDPPPVVRRLPELCGEDTLRHSQLRAALVMKFLMEDEFTSAYAEGTPLSPQPSAGPKLVIPTCI